MPNRQSLMHGVKSFVAWEWISSVTKSLFKLASYVVELPMVASGVYIMIATGVPEWNNAGAFNLAMAVLLAAPEILAPGAFFRAETMQSRGKTRAARVTRYLAGAMLFFAALTFSSIMIFHWDSNVMQGIMFFRVMTSLGYSIITRIDMEHGHSANHTTPPALQFDSWAMVGLMAHLQQEMQQTIAGLQASFNQRLEELASKQSQKVNLVDLQVQRLLSEVQDLQETSEPEIDYQQLAVALGPLFEQRMNASVSAIKTTIIEEVRATLPVASDPPQIEARARSQSRSQKGQKVDSEPRTKPEPASPARGNKEPEERLQAAYELLIANSIRVSGRLLAKEAHVNRGFATEWLSGRLDPAQKVDLDPVDVVDSGPVE